MIEIKEYDYQLPGMCGVGSFNNTILRATYGNDRIERNDIELNFYIYSNPTTSSAYWGAVYHPNNNIYYIPYSETTVEEIDTQVANGIFFGSAGASTTKYRGGFLGKDNKIYCIPSTETEIGIIDPIARTIDTASWTLGLAGIQFGAGCYGQDGKYYMAPSDSANASIGILDIENKQTSLVTISGSYYASGAVMVGDKIWFIPRDDDDAYVYDVWKKSYEKVNCVTNGYASFGYRGGVLAPDGCIYCAPSSADKILKICTITKKTSLVGSYTNASTLAFCQAIYAPDDYIYMIPHSSQYIVRLDWRTGETKEIDCYVGSSKWGPGCFDRNGKFWTSTYSGDSILCMDFQQRLNENNILYNQGLNGVG